MRKDPIPRVHPQEGSLGRGLPPRFRGVRGARRQHCRRGAAAPSADLRHRAGARRARPLRLSLHQRFVARAQAGRIPAGQAPQLLRAHGRPARGTRSRRLPRRRLRRRGQRHPHGARPWFPRDDQYHSLRGRQPGTDAPVLRSDDGARGRGDDDLPWLFVREGARPGPFPAARAVAQAVLPHAGESQAELAVQPVALLLAVPDGQARLRVHALGQSDLQRLRLAAALLSLAGRLRPHLPRAVGRDRLVEVRPQERKPALPGLHGALRIRAERGACDLRLAPVPGRVGARDGDGAAVNEASPSGPSLSELVERAFDYRGYVTVILRDGSEMPGYLYDRGPAHVDLFDETATRRMRLSRDEIVDIRFTGDDPVRKSQEIWERRKGSLEPRDSPAHGGWAGPRPVLLAVALEQELQHVARALGLRRHGASARGRLQGSDVVALAVGIGGGAGRAVLDEEPRLVVSCGFCGALDPRLQAGDLVLATAVRIEGSEAVK